MLSLCKLLQVLHFVSYQFNVLVHRSYSNLVYEHFLIFTVYVKFFRPVNEIILRFMLELELKVLQWCNSSRLIML